MTDKNQAMERRTHAARLLSPALARVALRAPAITDVTSDGYWQIYTGVPAVTFMSELNRSGPINLIVDLDTLQARGDRIAALLDHCQPTGTWSEIAIDQTGIAARLTLLDGSDPATHGLPLFDAARQARLAIAQGFPWQASLGAIPDPARGGFYEQITEATMINGRQVVPADLPLFVLRNGLLDESSVVLFGADGDTGKIAASALHNQAPSQDITMSLKDRRIALQARLGERHANLIAARLTDGATDDEVAEDAAAADAATAAAEAAAATATHTQQLADANATIVTLKAAQAELEAKITALTPPPAAAADDANLRRMPSAVPGPVSAFSQSSDDAKRLGAEFLANKLAATRAAK